MQQVQIKPIISFSDFQKLDLRIGKIAKAERKEGSKNLLRLKVYFGSEVGERSILTGIAQWYTPDDILDKKFIFITNLESRKIMDEESQGMILCAVKDDGSAIVLPIDDKIQEGTIIR